MVPNRPNRAIDLSKRPPPAYRSTSGTITETDTWSDYSASSGLGKRRGSWVNLVESDENLNRHKVNCYPKVKKVGILTVEQISFIVAFMIIWYLV
ncbi:unnamed protein product [Strongylus vulgaris]|uniref:Uncharacterized protein n=1 Tax=Strongylus vulgaris TaxID=40348 RepID=A0A3P7LFL5_STRVU|nr:unnamed protein product [Strongylus vulgaris]